jgi:hypothetical protein
MMSLHLRSFSSLYELSVDLNCRVRIVVVVMDGFGTWKK